MNVFICFLLFWSSTMAINCRWFKSSQMCEKKSRSCFWCKEKEVCVEFGKCQDEYFHQNLLDQEIDDYTDDIARMMMKISAASYADDPQPCLNNIPGGIKLEKHFTVNCDPDTSDSCFGFIATTDNSIIIAFRGSTSQSQIAKEIQESVFMGKVAFPGGGYVSKYFHNSFISLWNAGLKDEFIIISGSNKNRLLWITGHSLGGAIASLAAGTIISDKLYNPSRIKLITYGQPRTGDIEFAKLQNENLQYVYRVVHNTDLVPHVPPMYFENYFHHGSEIWYNNDMSIGSPFQTCLVPDSMNCSNTVLFTSISDHIYYFGYHVSTYWRTNCTIGYKLNLLN